MVFRRLSFFALALWMVALVSSPLAAAPPGAPPRPPIDALRDRLHFMFPGQKIELQLPDGLPVLTSPITGAFSLLFATSARSDVPLAATISLLSTRGFAKTLAEPTLVALSGQEATFLAGGEFPVPIPQALGVISVEFKKFGVQLRFTPYVLGDDTIQLKLSTIVSDIDFSIGLRLANAT